MVQTCASNPRNSNKKATKDAKPRLVGGRTRGQTQMYQVDADAGYASNKEEAVAEARQQQQPSACICCGGGHDGGDRALCLFGLAAVSTVAVGEASDQLRQPAGGSRGMLAQWASTPGSDGGASRGPPGGYNRRVPSGATLAKGRGQVVLGFGVQRYKQGYRQRARIWQNEGEREGQRATTEVPTCPACALEMCVGEQRCEGLAADGQ